MMETKDVSARRQLLARKNYGRRQMSEYLSNLSSALSQTQDAGNLLSLEETDNLYGNYTKSFGLAIGGKGSAYRQTWPSTEKDALELKLNCFRNKVAEDEVILFSRGFDYSGALKVGFHRALEHIFELIFIDGDSVALLDTDTTNGLMLDTYDDSEAGSDQVYELVIWGDDWSSAIYKC